MMTCYECNTLQRTECCGRYDVLTYHRNRYIAMRAIHDLETVRVGTTFQAEHDAEKVMNRKLESKSVNAYIGYMFSFTNTRKYIK